ncbi:porphobilinogen deaminase [Gloeomargarita lithophora Alchichica-D10]|uniref:Porphobilinogen deaminase n=1 Tax=Gloeomargarita lithophora Alchichica-D10 TaxID=1188229 RepID=A0A1J0AC87_9CYAN|nr:hydroxymethylbilane synthase [Gloeomargarita lithophora]APB33521.1 porphobilinogen deaminase [Gloeomargarita lithophora Alchichica-D10]
MPITRIGSRQSQLALVQTHWVQSELQKHYADQEFPLVTMTTQGDKILDVALAKIGDKGLFTKELEQALLRQEVDLAVHSLKDLPTQMPDGLALGAITEREEPRDALVLHPRWQGTPLAELPPGTVIGTSSLRRLAQLRYHFPHLAFKDIRGNLNTRLRKLDAGEYDGLILAVAGLRRLGWGERVSEVLEPEISLYAVGQGALGVQCRGDDGRVLALLAGLNHPETALRCLAERALLRALEGGCQVPIGVHSQVNGQELTLTGAVLSVDGQQRVAGCQTGVVTEEAQAVALGEALAQDLRAQGATAILQAIFAEVGRG